MIVRTLQQAQQSSRRIEAENWNSVRLLLKSDGVGFSFHITTIYAKTKTIMHYKNHYESVYCISGSGELKVLETGRVFTITPGTLYVLDNHDKHELYAHTDLQLACVFNPPLIGTEVHDRAGVYPLDADVIVD
jgi:L-ectoine synthase